MGGHVNRALLESYYQNPGDTYEDNMTEGAMEVIAQQVDDNWDDHEAHRTAAEIDHPDGSVTNRKIRNGTITANKFVPGALTNDTQNGLRITELEEEVTELKAETVTKQTNIVAGHGADPFGVDDSTIAIHEAISAAEEDSEIYVPYGIYIVDGLVIDKRIKLWGPGTLKIKDSALTPKIAITTDGVQIKGLEIDGNKDNNSTSIGIDINANNVTVEGCYIYECGLAGINATGNGHVIKGNRIKDIGDYATVVNLTKAGIRLYGTPDGCVVQDNIIDHITSYGICFHTSAGTKNNRIIGNTVKNSSFIGIGQQLCNHHLIANNFVTGCYDNGIDAQICHNTSIIGNQSVDNGTGSPASKCGIFFGSDTVGTYATDFLISGNLIKGNGKLGLQIDQVKRGSVTGNTILNNVGQGMICSRSESVVITGNEIAYNGSSGQQGIDISSANYIVITGNMVHHNGNLSNTLVTKMALANNSGIKIAGGTCFRITISGNMIYNNSGAGICTMNSGPNWISQVVITGNNIFDTAKVTSDNSPAATSQKYGIYVDTDMLDDGVHLVSGVLIEGNASSNHLTQDIFIGTQVRACIKKDIMTGLIDYAAIDTSYDDAWNGRNRFKLGSYTLWIDASGRLRIKNGNPNGDLDGSVVGTQT